MGTFDDLLKRAAGFVDKQKGLWDHAAWASFIGDIRHKGVELTKESEDHMGTVLESMRRLYGAPGAASKSVSDALQAVSNQVAQFVVQSKGMWDHAAWERFLRDVQAAGIKLTGETTHYLGEILEASRQVYSALPIVQGADTSEPAKNTGAAKKAPAAKKEANAASAVAPIKKKATKTGASKSTTGKPAAAKTGSMETKKSAKATAKDSKSNGAKKTASKRRAN